MSKPQTNCLVLHPEGEICSHGAASAKRPTPVTTNTTESLDELIGDIFARACKNNEYFGNDGWYELHTPTLRQEIKEAIQQEVLRGRVKGQINSYQRVMLWLEEQDPSDDYTKLSEVIQKSIDELFAELNTLLGGENDG